MAITIEKKSGLGVVESHSEISQPRSEDVARFQRLYGKVDGDSFTNKMKSPSFLDLMMKADIDEFRNLDITRDLLKDKPELDNDEDLYALRALFGEMRGQGKDSPLSDAQKDLLEKFGLTRKEGFELANSNELTEYFGEAGQAAIEADNYIRENKGAKIEYVKLDDGTIALRIKPAENASAEKIEEAKRINKKLEKTTEALQHGTTFSGVLSMTLAMYMMTGDKVRQFSSDYEIERMRTRKKIVSPHSEQLIQNSGQTKQPNREDFLNLDDDSSEQVDTVSPND